MLNIPPYETEPSHKMPNDCYRIYVKTSVSEKDVNRENTE